MVSRNSEILYRIFKNTYRKSIPLVFVEKKNLPAALLNQIFYLPGGSKHIVRVE